MFCGQGLWWVMPPIKFMHRVGTPSGFQSIASTFVRHTVSRCLIFPALQEVTSVTWSKQANSRRCYIIFGSAGKVAICIHVVSSSPLPTGQYGLCFGYCFSGLLPLRSHLNSPPFGVCFRESLVSSRLYSEIDQLHLSIEAQCGTTYLPLGDCHRNT